MISPGLGTKGKTAPTDSAQPAAQTAGHTAVQAQLATPAPTAGRSDLMPEAELTERISEAHYGFPETSRLDELRRACTDYLVRGQVLKLAELLEAAGALPAQSAEHGLTLPRIEQVAFGLSALYCAEEHDIAATRYAARFAMVCASMEHFRAKWAPSAGEEGDAYHERVLGEIYERLPESVTANFPRADFIKTGAVDLWSHPEAISIEFAANLGSHGAHGLHSLLFEDDHRVSVILVTRLADNHEASKLHELEHADGKLRWGADRRWTIEERLIDEMCAGLAGGELPHERIKSVPDYTTKFLSEAAERGRRLLPHLESSESARREHQAITDDLVDMSNRRPEFHAALTRTMTLVWTLTEHTMESDRIGTDSNFKKIAMQLVVPLLRETRSLARFNERFEAFARELIKSTTQS